MKILMCGLDDAGKTSFLLSVDRKYSKLIGLKPTLGAEVSSIEAFGSSIFLWDLGGQQSSREKYINKAQIYLYETDLLFFFIEVIARRPVNTKMREIAQQAGVFLLVLLMIFVFYNDIMRIFSR